MLNRPAKKRGKVHDDGREGKKIIGIGLRLVLKR